MTQTSRIEQHLIRHGSITTVQAVRMFILRLGARIWELRQRGMRIETEHIKGKSYVKYKYKRNG